MRSKRKHLVPVPLRMGFWERSPLSVWRITLGCNSKNAPHISKTKWRMEEKKWEPKFIRSKLHGIYFLSVVGIFLKCMFLTTELLLRVSWFIRQDFTTRYVILWRIWQSARQWLSKHLLKAEVTTKRSWSPLARQRLPSTHSRCNEY
jgi:hypothetical protein